MLMRKILVLAVAQAAKGSPGTPTPEDNAILCRTAAPSLITAEYVERTLLKGIKGNDGTFTVGEHRVLDFEIENASSGAAGTAPAFGPLLEACGMEETVTASTSVAYSPVDDGEPYMTLWCYIDHVLFKLEDAKLTVSSDMNAKGVPVLKFKAIGKYIALVDQDVPFSGADFSAFKKPKTVGKVNTPTFTIHGIAVKSSAFSWDLGNELGWRDLIGEQGADSPDRKPKASAVFELTTAATKNWGETARLGTEAAIQMIHGVDAGSVVQIDMPKAQFSADPAIQEQSKRAFLSGQFSLNPNAGNDELVLTYK